MRAAIKRGAILAERLTKPKQAKQRNTVDFLFLYPLSRLDFKQALTMPCS